MALFFIKMSDNNRNNTNENLSIFIDNFKMKDGQYIHTTPTKHSEEEEEILGKSRYQVYAI